MGYTIIFSSAWLGKKVGSWFEWFDIVYIKYILWNQNVPFLNRMFCVRSVLVYLLQEEEEEEEEVSLSWKKKDGKHVEHLFLSRKKKAKE